MAEPIDLAARRAAPASASVPAGKPQPVARHAITAEEFMELEAQRGRETITTGLAILRDAAGADAAIAFLEMTLLAISPKSGSPAQRAVTAAAIEGIAEAYAGAACPPLLTGAMVAENLRLVAAQFQVGPPVKPEARHA